MSFSVLLSVYYKENPGFLNPALESIWLNQELKPAQIVLVKDGPLNGELEKIITRWVGCAGDVLTIVPLVENVGLAEALNEGLHHCDYDIVARMDTDDVSLPERFKKQYQFMMENADISVCSGQIEEWSQDLSYKVSERILPLRHEGIANMAMRRCPVRETLINSACRRLSI